jgi:hypothetical protein
MGHGFPVNIPLISSQPAASASEILSIAATLHATPAGVELESEFTSQASQEHLELAGTPKPSCTGGHRQIPETS